MAGPFPHNPTLDSVAAAARDEGPVTRPLPQVVYTEGSACDAADTLLARAALVVVWEDAGLPRSGAGNLRLGGHLPGAARAGGHTLPTRP